MKPCTTARYDMLLVQQMCTTDFSAWWPVFHGAVCFVPSCVDWSWSLSACFSQMDRYCIVSTRQARTANQEPTSTKGNLAYASQLVWLVQVTACLAAAVVHVAQLPAKLNQVIQPLMAALRKEPHQPFQRVAAQALAKLMLLCIARQPCPNDRVIKNACALVHQENGAMISEDSADVPGPVQSPAAKVSHT